MSKTYKLCKCLSVLFIIFCLFIIALYIYAYLSPKIEIKNANTYYLYDKDNNLIFQGSSSQKWVNLSDVSKDYINAVIATEDKNFYKHNGFDYIRIIKALYSNLKSKKIVQGASTISQQYVKNLSQNFEKTWKRKWNETLLTLNLEMHYKKDQILEGYINTINFGQGNIGIANAAQYYFDKKPSELTTEEAIILAGIPKSPNNYNPVTNYDKSIDRAKLVLNNMVKNNYLTKEKADSLFQNEISIYGQNSDDNLNMIMYYQDAVMNELESKIKIPQSIIQKKGIRIYTNLDINAQKELEKSINSYMKGESMQVASVIIDPRTSGVLALSGGLDYSKSQYNRAIQAKRQVGSTMKSFLYYAALENNLTSTSIFTSELSTFTMDNGKTYSPQNYGNKYANKGITMGAAIALSDNIYAIKTNMFIGGDKLIKTARNAGINEHLKDIPSLPLGTIEISMIDYAQGYATLANGGIKNDIHFINKVEDSDGNILYEYKNKNDEVLNYNYVYILNELLTSTTNPSFKDYTNPTALIIKDKLDDKYAIKTGTTKTDFWTIGYNNNKLMLVWCGNDDGSEVSSSKSFYSKNIFADTISKIDVNSGYDSWYEMPDDVVAVPLNAIDGTTSDKNTALFYFLKGTEYIEKE